MVEYLQREAITEGGAEGGNGDKGLRTVDFVNSGLQKDLGWAIEGSRENVERIANEMVVGYERAVS
jgi:hypothetical protein